MEFGGLRELQVFLLAGGAGHRRVEQDRDAGRFDGIEEEISFGGAVEDEAEVEFGAQAQRGGDVVVAVGGDDKRDFAAEDGGKRFEVQVAIGEFRRVVSGGGAFPLVLARLDEIGAKQGDGFGPCARRLFGFAEPLGAERDGDAGEWHEDIGGGEQRGAVRLDDHRLTGHERARRVAGMQRGHTQLAHPLHERVAAVEGVESAQFRLKRRRGFQLLLVAARPVEQAGQADRAARVDQPGERDIGFDDTPAVGNRNVGGGTDALDFAIGAAEDDGVPEGGEIAGHWMQRARLDGKLGARGAGREQEAKAKKDEEVERVRFHRLKQQVEVRSALPAPGPPSAISRSSARVRSNTFSPSIHVSRTRV